MDERLAGKKGWLVVLAIAALAVVLRALAFSLFDTIAHDEILQYQERAWRMVFGYGIVPWETRYGMRNPLIPDLMAGSMAAATWFSGNPWASVITARIVFAAVCLGALPAAYWVGSVRSRTHGLAALFVAAVWYESVLFGVHVLSESIALPFAVGGAAALLRAREDRRMALLAGLLLTLAVLLRLQFVVFAGTVALLSIGRDWRLYPPLLLGALPALALGAATDLAAGATPFAWAINNFTMNVTEGRADIFGIAGPFYYVGAVFLRLLPVSPLILVAALFAGKRYHPLLIAAIASIAAHSLIGHKEYRFVWLSVFVFVILAAIASVDFLDRVRARRQASPTSRPAWIAALCLVWAALSLTAWQMSGGFGSIRDGGAVTRATIRAANIPETCAIALPVELRKPVGYVFLQREVALYLLPDEMDGVRQPFPKDVTDAIDTLVTTDKARLPAPYRNLGCAQDVRYRVCLWRREGGCRNREAASWRSYDAILRKNDM